VLCTAFIELLINAYSIILIGHMPGFPPGHSIIVFCDLSLTYILIPLIPFLLPPRIDRASIYILRLSPAKS